MKFPHCGVFIPSCWCCCCACDGCWATVTGGVLWLALAKPFFVVLAAGGNETEELAEEEGVVEGMGGPDTLPVGVVTSAETWGGGPDASLFIGRGLIRAAMDLPYEILNLCVDSWSIDKTNIIIWCTYSSKLCKKPKKRWGNTVRKSWFFCHTDFTWDQF